MIETRRVLTVAPMPPEKAAYALARYSRSPDSIRESIEWVRNHDSQKFLESFYFAYGHASIADLGHLCVCFEGISELAATEIEDEQLWDGQARSSRYQNFGGSGFIVPADLAGADRELFTTSAQRLLSAYSAIHEQMIEHYRESLPRPESMKPDAYERNIAARAFDVARYCLFFGVPTGVGQVVSIRTLERQVRRMKASEYPELVELGDELARACAEPPACLWDDADCEPLAPTLARHVEADTYPRQAKEDVSQWARQNLGTITLDVPDVDLIKPADPLSDIAATLLYTATNVPFRALYETVVGWSAERKMEVVDVSMRSKSRRDEMLREFRTAPYVFDLFVDIGAYRDLHRHRRCQQFRQSYRSELHYATPAPLVRAGKSHLYESTMTELRTSLANLPQAAAHYLLPFAAKSRFLFKMDFAEAEYICRLRSGVKGHFSYREIAWEMKERMSALEPALGKLMTATPPWVEDPLKR